MADDKKGWHAITKEILAAEKQARAKAKKAEQKRKKTSKPGDHDLPAHHVKVGAPPKYREDFARQARHLICNGYTIEQLGDFFDVPAATIHRWCIEHPKFRDAIYTAPFDPAAAHSVEVGLMVRARGYKGMLRKEEFVEIEDDSTPTGRRIVGARKITVQEYDVPPSAQAAHLYLKNRRKKEWSEETVDEKRYVVVIPPSTDRSRASWLERARQLTGSKMIDVTPDPQK